MSKFASSGCGAVHQCYNTDCTHSQDNSSHISAILNMAAINLFLVLTIIMMISSTRGFSTKARCELEGDECEGYGSCCDGWCHEDLGLCVECQEDGGWCHLDSDCCGRCEYPVGVTTGVGECVEGVF